MSFAASDFPVIGSQDMANNPYMSVSNGPIKYIETKPSTPMPDKANLNTIFGSALFGIVDDLVTAKENGQQLPGLLDKIAGVASDAKKQGIDIAKEEAKNQAMKYVPHAIAGVLLIIVIVLIVKRK